MKLGRSASSKVKKCRTSIVKKESSELFFEERSQILISRTQNPLELSESFARNSAACHLICIIETTQNNWTRLSWSVPLGLPLFLHPKSFRWLFQLALLRHKMETREQPTWFYSYLITEMLNLVPINIGKQNLSYIIPDEKLFFQKFWRRFSGLGFKKEKKKEKDETTYSVHVYVCIYALSAECNAVDEKRSGEGEFTLSFALSAAYTRRRIEKWASERKEDGNGD